MSNTTTTDARKPRVCFLCTGNSCRSQMAEGWARRLRADDFDACSAGTDPHGLNPDAVAVMRESGVDIAGHWSKTLEQLGEPAPDVIVAVCDSAAESCPAPPAGVRVIRHAFEDPPRLAAGAATEEDRLRPYRRVRDEIRRFIESFDPSARV